VKKSLFLPNLILTSNSLIGLRVLFVEYHYKKIHNMIKQLSKYVLPIAFSILSVKAIGHSHESKMPNNYSGVKFLQNKGQWHKDAKFQAIVSSGEMYITDYGLVYSYIDPSDVEKAHDVLLEKGNIDNYVYNFYAYKVKFKGANKQVNYVSSNATKDYTNYIIGNDPSKWATYVYGFGEVAQNNVYDNINVKYYSDPSISGFKYDFIVKPNGNPHDISLEFEGVKPVLNSKGELVLNIGFDKIIESAPYTYQIVEGRKVEITSKYKVLDNIVKFEFPNGYNKNLDLIIDPSVVYATFSGGTGTVAQYAHSATYDADGNTYTCALSYGANWPTTTGAYQTTYPGGYCVGVHKFSADGTSRIYGTYIGGSSACVQPFTARVNDNNELVVAGAITSTTLPVLPTSYDNTLGGGQDIYLVKLSSDGSLLLGSTYLGGSASECIFNAGTTGSYTALQGQAINPIDIAFDQVGNIWLASNTASSDFPVTTGALQGTFAGGSDIVIAKFNPNLSSLLYSTFYGGNGGEGASTIEFSNDYTVLAIGGTTLSNNFPVTAGVVGGTFGGGSSDGFVITLNPITNQLIGASYFGTNGADAVAKLDFDCGGNIYMCGQNSNGNYPVNADYSNANGKLFIHKVSANLQTSHLTTTIGSSSIQQVPMGFMVDICGNIYVNAVYSSPIAGLPLTPDAIQTTPGSFWMIVLEPSLVDLYFATYYGSSSGDHNHPGVHRLDESGYAYASVCGTSTAFPTTPNAVNPIKLNSSNDNITFKFDFEARGAKVVGESPQGGFTDDLHAIRGCKSAWLHFTRPLPDTVPTVIKLEILGDAVNGLDYEFLADSIIIPANSNNASLEIKALRRTAPTGIRKVIVNSFSMCSCSGVDMGERTLASSDTILIIDSLYVSLLTPYDTSCPGDKITITAQIDPTLKYKWSPANLIPDASGLTIEPSPSVTTTFELEVWQDGAPSTCPNNKISYVAFVEPYPVILIPNDYLTICYKDSVSVAMQVVPENPRYKYLWEPQQFFGNPNSGVTKFFAPVGEYEITQTATTPGAGCTTSEKMTIKVVSPLKIQGVTPSDTVINLGDEIEVSVISDESVMWLWTPADYIEDPNMKTIKVTPLQDMVYTITAWDQYGCFDQSESKIKVQYSSQLFIPNAFSPNDDGLNDVFAISNLQYDKLVSFKVFNRYGELLFETSNPDKGWDGTNKAGEKVGTDTYYYHIEIMSPLSKDKQKTFKGDVTLIR
jgi:gliding motility-associated-like protein